MDERVYWIWVQRAFGAGSPKPMQMFRRFPGGLAQLHEGGPALWNRMESISEKEARGLTSYTLEEAEALLGYCDALSFQVLTPECEKYPEALRNIFDPPAVLYVKGIMPDLDDVPTVAIVGAREAAPEAVEAATGIAHQLSLGGAKVVSGGALGIDTAALSGALRATGRPISILPASLNSNYVIKNEYLRNRIVERGGTLISEFATESSVGRGTFQIRNRLLSGISCGTLIIQAAVKSGTMITAKFAKEQDRDVFVYPGIPGDERFAGNRGLIEDGAIPVSCGEDILREYALRFPYQPAVPEKESSSSAVRRLLSGLRVKKPVAVMAEESSAEEHPVVPELSEIEKRVCGALSDEPQDITALSEKTGIPVGKILPVLTKLELTGAIRSHAGKTFSRT